MLREFIGSEADSPEVISQRRVELIAEIGREIDVVPEVVNGTVLAVIATAVLIDTKAEIAGIENATVAIVVIATIAGIVTVTMVGSAGHVLGIEATQKRDAGEGVRERRRKGGGKDVTAHEVIARVVRGATRKTMPSLRNENQLKPTRRGNHRDNQLRQYPWKRH